MSDPTIGPDGFTRLSDGAYDRLHGVDGYAQAVTPRHAPEALTMERVSDWRDSLQLLHDLARGHDYADARDLAAGEDAIAEVCGALTGVANQVAEHQWNALEMSRKAEQAERRAEEAEFHVEQLRDARDRAERRVEAVEAVLASGPDAWTPYESRDTGWTFLQESVLDFTADLRAAVYGDRSADA